MARLNFEELDRGGHGGFTLALAPLFFGFLGFLVDRGLGWTPVLTIIGVVYGLLGGVYKVIGDYRRKMDEEGERRPGVARSAASR